MLRVAGTSPCAHIIVRGSLYFEVEAPFVAMFTAVYRTDKRTVVNRAPNAMSDISCSGVIINTMPNETKKKASNRKAI